MQKKIKWGFIEPLTGGMALGAEKAIGSAPDWVLSFPGFCSHTENQDGTVKSAMNEYHYLTYMKKHNKLPPYLTINRQPFADFTKEEDPWHPELIKNEFSTTDTIDLSNTDLVCALPVCSGLSNATTTKNDETRELRNRNMQWITKFVLEHIKPKVYIFENAPALFAGDKGKPIREFIDKTAEAAGYSVTYFKTDTCLHHNAQRRPRTFVICWKWTGTEKEMPPIINFERDEISVKDFLDEMPVYEQNDEMPLSWPNQNILDYFKQAHPTDYRELLKERSGFAHIIECGEKDQYIEFCKTYQWKNADPATQEKHRACLLRSINHTAEKYAAGSWIFDTTTSVIDDKKKLPSIMHKVTTSKLHPYKDRLLTVGEILYCMGMPTDYHIYGETYEKSHQTGQNVPVNTARYIVSEIVRVLNDWEVERRNTNGNPFFGDNDNVEFVDNTKQTYSLKPKEK